MDPRGGEAADPSVSGGSLDLSTISLPELLHLVAALDGGLRGAGGASRSDIVGYLLPVVGAEVAAPEGIPLVSVSIDEGDGLVRGPAGRGQAAGGGGGGDGGES